MVFNLFVFLFGFFVGSFLNCVIYRLALPNFSFWKNLGGLKNRSFCPKCRHKLNWYDLVPVFSFLILRGKCRYCGEKISWQYPAVEIGTGLMFLLIFNFQFSIFNEFSWTPSGGLPGGLLFNFQNIFNTVYLLIISCFLIIIFVYDLEHYIIPDKVLLPAIVIAFLYRLFENLVIRHWGLIENWKSTFWGVHFVSREIENSAPVSNFLFSALISFGLFLTIFLISGGRWLGFGDVKLVFLMGFILGFPNILAALFLAFFFGAIIGIGLIVFGKKKLKSEIPFGPFLVTGTFIAMLWGKELITWYLSLIT